MITVISYIGSMMKYVGSKAGATIVIALILLSLSIELKRSNIEFPSHIPFLYSFQPKSTEDTSDSCEGKESYFLTQFILLRGISFVYLIAFRSLSVQIEGLIGYTAGLLPLGITLNNIRKILRKSQNPIPNSPIHAASTATSLITNTSHDRISDNFEGMRKNPFNTLTLYLTQFIISPVKDWPNYSEFLCHVCTFLSLIGILYPHTSILIVLYVTYMAFKKVSGAFLNFAWDALLLEAGFLAILSSMATETIAVTISNWLFRILLFRLIFGSGMVKLLSKDKSWNESFTALSYHFLTQPLPKPIASLIYILPSSILSMATITTIVIECMGPIFSLFPVLEQGVFAVYVLLQGSIMTTGNYGFFNILTIVLSISLLPDTVLSPLVPKGYTNMSLIVFPMISTNANIFLQEIIETIHAINQTFTKVPITSKIYPYLPYFTLLRIKGGTVFVLCMSFVIIIVHIQAIILLFQRLSSRLSKPGVGVGNTMTQTSSMATGIYLTRVIHSLLTPFYLGGHYGLFGTMTKVREELVIFVSKDGNSEWTPIEFAYKPGLPNYRPRDIFPWFHMPRLDWLMWFVAIRPEPEDWPDWFWRLLYGLLENRKETQSLMNPTLNKDVFEVNRDMDSGNLNPYVYQFIRVQLFEYRYGSAVGRRKPTVSSNISNTTEVSNNTSDTSSNLSNPSLSLKLPDNTNQKMLPTSAESSSHSNRIPVLLKERRDSMGNGTPVFLGGIISPRGQDISSLTTPRETPDITPSTSTNPSPNKTFKGKSIDTNLTSNNSNVSSEILDYSPTASDQVDSINNPKIISPVVSESASTFYPTSPSVSPRFTDMPNQNLSTLPISDEKDDNVTTTATNVNVTNMDATSTVTNANVNANVNVNVSSIFGKTRKFWSIKFLGDLLPPMPITHVMIYHEKLKNKRRYHYSHTNGNGNSTSDKDGKEEMSDEKAADIIRRFTFYSNNSKLQEGMPKSSEYQSKPIRAPIQRSPVPSPKTTVNKNTRSIPTTPVSSTTKSKSIKSRETSNTSDTSDSNSNEDIDRLLPSSPQSKDLECDINEKDLSVIAAEQARADEELYSQRLANLSISTGSQDEQEQKQEQGGHKNDMVANRPAKELVSNEE